MAAADSVANESRPASTLLATSASKPGSKIGIFPFWVPDLRCIPIDTDYDVPKIRKACAGHEPDVAGTHHCYSHEMLSGVLPLATFSTRSRTIFLRRYGSRDRRLR